MAECNLTIGVFGRRRAGKSCLVRCLGGKAAPPAGPGATEEVCVNLAGIGRACVVLPAGLDDERALGVDADRASEIVERVDIALVVIDAALGWSDYERFLLSRVRFAGDSVIVLVNRPAGQNVSPLLKKLESFGMPVVEADLSSEADAGRIIAAVREEAHRRDGDPNLLEGLLGKGESVWVVVPVSRPSYVGPVGPPEERLARDAVRSGISVCVLKEAEFLERWASGQGRPRLVVSDAAVFGAVEQAEGLVGVGGGVGGYLFRRELFARSFFVGRIPDQAGEVTDEKGTLMAQLLELAQFAHGDRMPQANIGRGRVHT